MIKLFIVPRSRTGGTLLATMLNAHPQISMGYEIYPDLLVRADGSAFDPKDLHHRLTASRHDDNAIWAGALSRDGFRVFVARARRSGLEPDMLLEVLDDFAASGRLLDSECNRLDFIDALLQLQAARQDKPFIGSKMRVSPHVLHRRHPDAAYLMMLRDGRDVLDSRLKIGNFNTSADACAHEWKNDLALFETFVKETCARGMLVRYEELVINPRPLLTRISALIGIDYDGLMLTFAEQDQPLFRNPHGHLSAQQISKGLSNSSVGRWKSGLEAAQVTQFMDIAGDTMRDYGYE